MQRKPLDITIAHKMINLHPDLSATDKRVGGALLDHFNRRTTQCDPGLHRIAELLQLSPRTAIRAVLRLHKLQLFIRHRHKGNLHRNRYEPNWTRFRELESAWRVRFDQKKKERLLGKNVSHSECQPCHASDDAAVTQTPCRKTLKETWESVATQGPQTAPPEKKGSKGLPTRENEASPRPSQPLYIPQSTTSYRDAALTAAERRWMTALNERYAGTPEIYATVIDAITPEMREAANAAELRCRGLGLSTILDQLAALGRAQR